jgi:hypothetical protein
MTWATDSIFVAGGDYVREFWAEFQDQAGVSAVVTVSAAGPVAYGPPAPWAALWLPVDDEAAYTPDQLALGADFIAAALRAGRKVLLHGPGGVHRTRPVVAAHLLQAGKSLARVLRELEEKPWLPPYKGDREVLAGLAASKRANLEEGRDTGDLGRRGNPAGAGFHERPDPPTDAEG